MGTMTFITSRAPKPPPVSGWITRTSRWGMSRVRAISARRVCGAWVWCQTVSWPVAPCRAMQPRVSMTAWDWRTVSNSSSTTTSQPAKAASTSPSLLCTS